MTKQITPVDKLRAFIAYSKDQKEPFALFTFEEATQAGIPFSISFAFEGKDYAIFIEDKGSKSLKRDLEAIGALDKDSEDLAESKEVKSLIECLLSLDANGAYIFIDSLSDCEGNEEIKDLCSNVLHSYLDPRGMFIEELSPEEVEQRQGSVDALDRASFFSNETWLAQLEVTVARALYGRVTE
jgi:hypothetical protein